MRTPRCLPKPPSQPLARVLERDAQLAVVDSAREAARKLLTALMRRYLPRPLAERVRVAGCPGPRLLSLRSTAGAVATVVRQRCPDLTAALRREGMHFTEIRMRVQVRGAPQRDAKTASASTGYDRAVAVVRRSRRACRDGPLKASLSRWSRRARRAR